MLPHRTFLNQVKIVLVRCLPSSISSNLCHHSEVFHGSSRKPLICTTYEYEVARLDTRDTSFDDLRPGFVLTCVRVIAFSWIFVRHRQAEETATTAIGFAQDISSHKLFMGFDLSSNISGLESHLATRSYVEGFEPSQADVALFNEVKTAPSASEYPHVSLPSLWTVCNQTSCRCKY